MMKKIKQFFHPYMKHYSIFLLFLPVLIWYILFCYVPMHGILIAFEDFKIGKGCGFGKFCEIIPFPYLCQVLTKYGGDQFYQNYRRIPVAYHIGIDAE